MVKVSRAGVIGERQHKYPASNEIAEGREREGMGWAQAFSISMSVANQVGRDVEGSNKITMSRLTYRMRARMHACSGEQKR